VVCTPHRTSTKKTSSQVSGRGTRCPRGNFRFPPLLRCRGRSLTTMMPEHPLDPLVLQLVSLLVWVVVAVLVWGGWRRRQVQEASLHPLFTLDSPSIYPLFTLYLPCRRPPSLPRLPPQSRDKAPRAPVGRNHERRRGMERRGRRRHREGRMRSRLRVGWKGGRCEKSKRIVLGRWP